MSATRPCPVCATPAEAARVFAENTIDAKRLSAFSFASRKEPEFMSHRLLRCPTCDLVYVSAPPSQDDLARAYHIADYDSAEEAGDAADAYIRAMRPILAELPARRRVLEIGAGTGALLARLEAEGFSECVGVEPSSAAIAAAPESRRAWLREGIFVESDFEPRSFDLVCCFMTMEHVQDPTATAGAARRLLAKDGAFVTVTHDYASLVNRFMGRKSPIIDIEHMQLFSRGAIVSLFERCGFEDVSAAPFYNRYALRYWLRLAPLPKPLKDLARRTLAATGLDRVKASVNVGNTMTAGFRRD